MMHSHSGLEILRRQGRAFAASIVIRDQASQQSASFRGVSAPLRRLVVARGPFAKDSVRAAKASAC